MHADDDPAEHAACPGPAATAIDRTADARAGADSGRCAARVRTCVASPD